MVKEQIESITKNSRTILDAFCKQQKKFDIICEKSQYCVDKNLKIERTISEIIKIFDEVFKNFYPERKPLNIFLKRNDTYNIKKIKKWIIGKENLPESGKYAYNELCLNNMGFTLLPTYGSKSYSVIEGGVNHGYTLYNLLALKDDVVLKTLTPFLKIEKVELMKKVLDNIEILKYESTFTKEQIIKYSIDSKEGGASKSIKDLSGKHIRFEAQGNAHLRFAIMKKEDYDYNDESFNLLALSFQDAMIVEQISEEIITSLNDYILFLENKEKEVDKYFLETKDKFIKELICLNLKNK